MGDEAALQSRVRLLEERLQTQERNNAQEFQRLSTDVQELRRVTDELERENKGLEGLRSTSSSNAHNFSRRVEWTIGGITAKLNDTPKGDSLWSPKFRAAGIDGLQLEFFPKGREVTTFEGFCSMFLWCPDGTRIKYQLFVGNFVRAPDEDEYKGHIGHGHSNFCPVMPEIDQSQDSIRVGVDFLDVMFDEHTASRGLRLVSSSIQEMVAREVKIIQNQGVNNVVWKIPKILELLQQFPRGASMWSKCFTVGGIREVLLELYPNGSTNSTKDGFCAFYIRCPEGVTMVVTLIVGKVRKGPIKTVFDSLTGKGLPDFCFLRDEINTADDSLEVGIELKNETNMTLLKLES